MLSRADLLVLWSRSVDLDGPDHPLTQRVRDAYEAAPPEPTNDDREEYVMPDVVQGR